MKALFFLALAVFALAVVRTFAKEALIKDEHTLLLAHFDKEDNLDADFAAGSQLANLQGKPESVKARYGRGVRIAGDAALTYDAKKNVDFRRGTVEMIVIPEWPSSDAPGQAYLFAIDYHSYFYCRIVKGERIEFRMYDHRLIAEELDWKKGEAHEIIFAWDSEVGLGLRVDGKGCGLTCTWKPFNLAFAPIAVGCVGKGDGSGRMPTFHKPAGGIIDKLKISSVPLIPIGEPLAKERFIQGEPPLINVARRRSQDAQRKCRGSWVVGRESSLIEFYNPEIVDSPIKIDDYQALAESYEKDMAAYGEDLKILYERNHLDEIIAPGRSEYEKQVLLCQWLTAQWPHYGVPPKGAPAYEVLDAARDGTGGGLCGTFASVLVDCFHSLGWNARYVSVSGHATFECWSNEFNKWAQMEPDYSGFPSKDGVPLNTMELHDLYVKSIQDPSVVETFDSFCAPFTQGHSPVAKMDDKGLHLYSTLRLKTSRGSLLYYDDYARMEKLPDDASEHHKKIKASNLERNKEAVEQRKIIETKDALYWTLNKASPSLSYSDDPNSLKVTLSRSLTPLFKDYVVRRDGGPLETKAEEFEWPLHSGVNTLEVMTRNQYGVCGHPSRIKVWVPYKASQRVSETAIQQGSPPGARLRRGL